MRCEAARENLKALSDGELGRVQSWRVRRHLARCAACEEERAMIERLNALLLSADRGERGVAALGRAGALAERSGTRDRIRIVYQLGSAAILALALVVGFHARNNGDPGVALAAAIEAVSGGRGWQTWHLASTAPDGKVTETWLRLPDAFREETRQGNILTELKAQRGKEAWIYLPAEKRAFHARTAIEDPAQYGDALRELKRAQERARTVGGLKVTEHPDRLADGRAVRVTEVEMDYEKHVGRPPEGNGPKTIHSRIVVDALSGRLVTWEQSGYTITSIAYDQPLPD